MVKASQLEDTDMNLNWTKSIIVEEENYDYSHSFKVSKFICLLTYKVTQERLRDVRPFNVVVANRGGGGENEEMRCGFSCVAFIHLFTPS